MLNSGPAVAILSASLFGASTPLAKLVLGGGVDPWLLAGLLYLGAGLGLAAFRRLRRAAGLAPAEAPLTRADLPWLALVVLFGGIIGPVLLTVGLAATPASAAALLLNVEGLATLAIAWLVFRENVDRRVFAGAMAILTGALLLSWQGGPAGLGFGALAILGACLAWGIDNNLTRRLSGADPVQITMVKCLTAGSTNLVLALWLHGGAVPQAGLIAAAGILGLFGYGVSLVLFTRALRLLGTARTGAYFSTAPFLGAVLSVALLDEPVTGVLLAAAALMALGLWLHLAERHEHTHLHEPTEHSHRHTHDAHHQHRHGAGDPPGEPHVHHHRHARLVHKHPHYPDLHHRHRHGPAAGSQA
jgi:drug/metabolite transporter (DMT)-like permease